MHIELLKARDNLKIQLLNNAKHVVNEVLNMNITNLVEIGVFGSVAKDTFSCNSDTDIYLMFDSGLPDRSTKGYLRTIAEENNCDIVFIETSSFLSKYPSILVSEILMHKIILWRRESQRDTE